MSYWQRWKPYVSAAERRAKAEKKAAALEKKGQKLQPIKISGLKIASTFWGKAWCENLERYSDFANRLPRGRTYARNGSILDLKIEAGKIKAMVCGSSIYKVEIGLSEVSKPSWKKLIQDCGQSIDSLMDLMQGRFSQGVMERLTRRDEGLFPHPKEIKLSCSCPDYASLCKHVAAVLYGVGNRLDTQPELLFLLRKVDHLELIGNALGSENLDSALGNGQPDALAGTDLSELFGIDLDVGDQAAIEPGTEPKKTAGKVKIGKKTPPRVESSRRSKSKAVSPAPVSEIAVVETPVVAEPQPVTLPKRIATKAAAPKKTASRAKKAKATAASKSKGKKPAAKQLVATGVASVKKSRSVRSQASKP